MHFLLKSRNMKRILYIAAAIVLASCSKSTAEQLAEAAKTLTVQCTPEVLTVLNDTVRAKISVNYPAGYFSKNAQVVVTPYVVYEGGQMPLPPFRYQGENVKDNNKVVPSTGGSVREEIVFPFMSGMEKSRLELRSTVFADGQVLQVPVIKVADGCINLVKWTKKVGEYNYKSDNYQSVVLTKAEGQILYDVNSANVKSSELSGNSIKTLQRAIAEGQESDRITVKGTKIISYASPEGGEELNDKLSEERSNSAQKAWGKIAKDVEAGSTEVHSVGQDWEGFKDAVENSDLADKDLILRVLSMYSDPAVRESEIKNLSQVYTEIKDNVFPELRRSRFITEMEYQNYTDADLQRLLNRKRLYLVDEEGLLRLASLTDSLELKQTLYRAAADRMGSERGRYNLGITLMEKGAPVAAEVYFDRLKDQSDKDLLNVRGVIALGNNELDKAADYFQKSGTKTANQNLGIVYLLKGDYIQAGKYLEGTNGRNEAIAAIYNGKYDYAISVLEGHGCPVSYYLRAVASARKGDAAGVKKYLDAAAQKAPKFKGTASKDIEFEGFEF